MIKNQDKGLNRNQIDKFCRFLFKCLLLDKRNSTSKITNITTKYNRLEKLILEKLIRNLRVFLGILIVEVSFISMGRF